MDLQSKIRGCGRESAQDIKLILAKRTMELVSLGNTHLANWIQSVGKASDDGARLALALTYVLEALFGALEEVRETGEYVLVLAASEARENPKFANATLARAQQALGNELMRAFLNFVHGTHGPDGQEGLRDADAGRVGLAIMLDAVWPEEKCGHTIPPGRLIWLRRAKADALAERAQKEAIRPR